MPSRPHRRDRTKTAIRSLARLKTIEKADEKETQRGRHRSCQASKMVRNGCINDRYQVSKNRRLWLPLASRRLSDAARAALAIKPSSPFSLEASACAWRDTICPQAKATEKSVGIFARAAPRR